MTTSVAKLWTPTSAGAAQFLLVVSDYLCFVLVVAVLHAEALRQYETLSISVGEERESPCTVSNGVALCDCSTGTSASATKLTARLSTTVNTIQLTCANADVGMPDPMESDMVCPVDSPDLSQCKPAGRALQAHKAANQAFPITQLLNGATDASLTWQQQKLKKIYALEIPPNLFPLTDQQFGVGCGKKGTNTSCKVKVTVAAKPSASVNQIVSCAYGADSNTGTALQSVTISPTHPSVTLDCGSAGVVQPEDHTTEHCPAGAPVQHKCDQPYTSIFKDFQPSWWSGDTETSHKATLTVPNDKFPVDEQKFVVGCKSQETINGGESTAGSTVCSVEVTVLGTSEMSSGGANTPSVLVTAGVSVVAAYFAFASLEAAFLQDYFSVTS
ncbi:srs domain-containing protein [Neospora caninum Liverpool]|uniref:Srs domain-containing protein n=1 Tax=Neospora caninum (strain Liverpool) TaxID=572307 RepID=F0VAH5_NEOCL|nr:srs domain-containing protein [Neospora caninum Liverpool]CBZ50664.1 srs domain-containing protein [Neospora caninum Liverpool]|eukprot:XP_003880697.1 srs domain-containing protein [Neospora caninum Liverpool]